MGTLSLNILRNKEVNVLPHTMGKMLCMQISDRRQNVTNWDQLPLMLTTEDLMNILGVSRTRAYQIVNIEGFPASRIGKLLLIEKNALKKWIEEHSNKG